MARSLLTTTVSLPLVRRLAFASLLANVGIVLTGGAVRLTGSGLGCPTWPRCTDESWTATGEMGIHGAVEFGNRTLTFVLGAVALTGFVAALALRPRRRSLVWLAGAVLAGIAIQGGIGGITVLTGLNPWIVGGHFLVSLALIATAYAFWRRAGEPDGLAEVGAGKEDGRGEAGYESPRTVTVPPGLGPAKPALPVPLRRLVWLVVTVAAALVTAGTVVTGSGPHAGDADVPRTGLDPQTVAQVHSDLGFLLLGLAVATWLALRAVAAPRPATRAAAMLVAAILAQGAIGLVQYATGLPELLVWFHLLGACLVWLASLHLLYATRVSAPTGRSERHASAEPPEHRACGDPSGRRGPASRATPAQDRRTVGDLAGSGTGDQQRP